MNDRIHALDGLRGFAALMIVIWHAPLAWTYHHLENLQLFVDLFFAISGFVIARSFGDLIEDGSDVMKFARSRFLRLYPVHLFVLCLMIATELGQGAAGMGQPFSSPQQSEGSAILHIFMVQSLMQDHLAFNAPAWSISVEACMYAMFAAICVVSVGSSGKDKAAFFATLSVIGALALAGSDRFPVNGLDSICRGMIGFCAGAAAFYSRWEPSRVVAKASWAVASIPFILPEMVTIAAWFFAPLVVSLTMRRTPGSKFLSSRLAVWLGTISYSIYMVHWFVVLRLLNVFDLAGKVDLDTANGGARKVIDLGSPEVNVAIIVLLIAATMMAATAIYHLVERPFMRAGREMAV